MEATETRSAIEFLTQEKKQIEIKVSDHVSTDGMFRYNQAHSGSGFFKTMMDLDWDSFFFEVSIKLAFAYNSRHERQTHDYPGDSEIEFMPLQPTVEVESCLRWDPELDEYEFYHLSADEKKAVQQYLADNINLEE